MNVKQDEKTLVPQVFKHEQFGNLRVVVINEQPWFVGKDVAENLGYVNPRDALAKHVDPQDKRVSPVATPGGLQNITLINKSGLYSLILDSQLPKAKEFRHWVTSEVLPQVDEMGSYSLPNVSEASNSLSEMELLEKIFGPHTDKFLVARSLRDMALLTRNRVLREGLIRQVATLLTGKEISEIEKDSRKEFIEELIGKI